MRNAKSVCDLSAPRVRAQVPCAKLDVCVSVCARERVPEKESQRAREREREQEREGERERQGKRERRERVITAHCTARSRKRRAHTHTGTFIHRYITQRAATCRGRVMHLSNRYRSKYSVAVRPASYERSPVDPYVHTNTHNKQNTPTEKAQTHTNRFLQAHTVRTCIHSVVHAFISGRSNKRAGRVFREKSKQATVRARARACRARAVRVVCAAAYPVYASEGEELREGRLFGGGGHVAQRHVIVAGGIGPPAVQVSAPTHLAPHCVYVSRHAYANTYAHTGHIHTYTYTHTYIRIHIHSTTLSSSPLFYHS